MRPVVWIGRWIELQAAASKVLDLQRSGKWNAIAPLGNRSFRQPQLAGQFGPGAEVLYRITGTHIAEFSALDTKCKTAELAPEVRYSGMNEHSEARGRRIREQRRMKRLTQQQLADILGVSKGLISQWEKGQIDKISHPNWMGLVEVLGVDAEMLEFGPDEPRPAPGEGAGRWRKRN